MLQYKDDKLTPKAEKIRLFLTDCDGCMTDGGMYYSESGEVMKCFNAKDGMGIELLRKTGIITGIITGEDSQIAYQRALKLHMEEIHLGIKNKLICVKEICDRLNILPSQTAYVGDDINDIDVMEYVGYAFTVPNAEEAVKKYAYYVCQRGGGKGAIRDIAEKIMDINFYK